MDTFSQIYSQKVLEHVRHPRNVGEIKHPDGVGVVGNRRCGDIMKLYIKIEHRIKNKQQRESYIKDVKFQTLGCGAAIATSSIITTMVKGKSVAAAEKITNLAVAKALGGLPAPKMHCSLLAADALKAAIANWRKKK